MLFSMKSIECSIWVLLMMLKRFLVISLNQVNINLSYETKSCLYVDTDQAKKAQFIVFSATMPDWVHKTTKKYMSKDFITVDLVKGNMQKTSANVEVIFSFTSCFCSKLKYIFILCWLASSCIMRLSRSSRCYKLTCSNLLK